MVFEKIFSALKRENILYYPGCMTKYNLKPIMIKYKALLSDMGIDFKMIEGLSCCGSPLLNAGYPADFEEIKHKNLLLLSKSGISKIITNCPHCYSIFKDQYLFPVEHITQTLEAHKHKLVPVKSGEEVSYHDACLLARKNNIIREPRALIKQAGFKIKEPLKNKEKTFCCGAGSGLKQNNPELANQIAKKRLSFFETKTVVVSCPYCYAHFRENVADKKKIVEISEMLVEE